MAGNDDLQSAGVQAPDAQPGVQPQGQGGAGGTFQQDASSMLRALSQGPMQQAQANPDMANWVGLAGFGAGLMGQSNPTLNPLIAAQEADRRQKMATYEVLRSVQAQRRQKSMDQLDLSRQLLGMANPDARMMGAKMLSGHLQSEGVHISPDALVDKNLTLDQRKQAYTAILAGGTDEYLTNSLGVPKNAIPNLRLEANSEPVLHMLGVAKDRLDLAKENRAQAQFYLEQRKQDAREAKDEWQRAQGEARLNQADRNAQMREKEFLARMDIADRRAKVAEDNYQLSVKKFEALQAHGPEEKRQIALDHAEWFANKLQEYAGKVDQQGFLPPTDKGVMGALAQGDTRALMAKAKRTTDANNPDWVFLTKHLQGEMIGYARSVQNDIGPRAMQAFQGAMQIMHDPPSLKALNEVVNGMRQAIQLGREGKDTAQQLIIRHPDGSFVKVPWRRGMQYDPGDVIVRVE